VIAGCGALLLVSALAQAKDSSAVTATGSYSSAAVIISDTISGHGTCVSSGYAITTNSATCAGSPVPVGPLSGTPAQSTTLNAPGSSVGTVTMSETSCGVQEVRDAAHSNTGLDHNTVTFGSSGPLGGLALGFTQSASSYVSTISSYSNPTGISVVAWFTTSGSGTIVGFTSSPDTSTATSSDRLIWIDSSGRVVWGVDTSSRTEIRSTSSYANGSWHQVVAELGSNGIALYVDGSRVAQNTEVTSVASYVGYWHLGWGNIIHNGWSDAPGNEYWGGSLADVAVIPSQLSSGQVTSLYSPSPATNAAEQSALSGLSPTAFWPLDDVGSAVYAGAIPNVSTPCGYVYTTVQTLTGATTVCVFPAGAGACPTPNGSATLATVGTLTLAGLVSGGSQTVTVTIKKGSVPNAGLGLHIGGGLTVAASSGSFTASLLHVLGWIDL